MTEKQYLGNYLGIVIQNDDFEKRGRVKVFVPHVNVNIHEKWNATFKEWQDKHFIFPDKDTNKDLYDILDYLKETLTWAEMAMPIFGGSASGRFNAYTGKGSTSDSNYWSGEAPIDGFRPLQNYVGHNRITDAFYQVDVSQNKTINPNSGQYIPSDYSNLARGVFSIPNVGAHVWVFFAGGDCNYPVVFASAGGEDDWKRIYTLDKKGDTSVSPDYPASYENFSSKEKKALDSDSMTFRSKHVFNSNKHSIELIDTDLNEALKLTHYSGSCLEFNNNTTSRLATNNDQLLVIGDQFLTVRHNQANYISNHQENIINGDRITKLGNFDKKRSVVLNLLNILRDTHQYKRLFETTRADAVSPYTSPLQTKAGSPVDCPVCGGSGVKFGDTCVTCEGSGKSPSSQDGGYGLDGNKNKIASKLADNQKQINNNELEAALGNGGDDVEQITGNKTSIIGVAFNDLESYRVDMKGKLRSAGVHVAKGGTYVSMAACPLVEYVDVDNIPGGDYDLTVCNKYTLNVGSKGIRMKTTGPLDIYGTIANISAESLNLVGKHEVLIGSDKRLEMRADVMNLRPFNNEKSTVLIEGQLGVSNNLKVVGGAHIEGELSYIHSTTPYEWYTTEVGYGPIAHFHRFKAPPWTLLDDAKKVRESQVAINEPVPVPNIKSPGIWIPV